MQRSTLTYAKWWNTKKKSMQKRSEQSSIVLNADQMMSFGPRVCHSSGRYGSAENVVTVEHSSWKMEISPWNFRKNGKKGKLKGILRWFWDCSIINFFYSASVSPIFNDRNVANIWIRCFKHSLFRKLFRFFFNAVFWSTIYKLKVRNPMMPIPPRVFTFNHQQSTPCSLYRFPSIPSA